MKVCMLAEKFPPEFTGSGKQAFALARALVKKDVNVIALCSSPFVKSSLDHSENFAVVRIRTCRQENLRSFEFAIKSLLWLWKNRHRYDILHIHGYCWAALSAVVVGKLLRKKTIYKVAISDDDDPRSIRASRLGWIKMLAVNRFDSFIAISRRIQNQIAGFGYPNARIFLIPNGVATRFSAGEEEAGKAKKFLTEKYRLKENCIIISYVGAIERRKGVDLIAHAWPKILSEVPESRIFLVGPYFEKTTYHQQLMALIQEDLGKTLFLVGEVSSPEVYYRASDVFVFPSRNESFGNVLAEAMAYGVPCVATRIEGVTEEILMNGYNGLVVNQEDHEGLAEAVVRILRRKDLNDHYSSNALKTVENKFRMDVIAERYIGLYDYLLKKRMKCASDWGFLKSA